VVVSGLYAADFSKIAFRILSGLGAVVILVTLLNLIMPEARRLTILAFLLNTCFFVMVTIALVAHVARARNVYGSTILCAVNSYLLLGLTMSILFLILDLLIPGSFSQVDSQSGMSSDFIYFGFVTLTTLGYGDITPSTLLSRSMSIFTALVGQLYLVIIMALIIGKFLSAKEAPD
jgi:voltage-gated potassium channel